MEKGIKNKRDQSRYCLLRDIEDETEYEAEGPWPPIYMKRADIIKQDSGDPQRNRQVLLKKKLSL
jgi:hypothetical protein